MAESHFLARNRNNYQNITAGLLQLINTQSTDSYPFDLLDVLVVQRRLVRESLYDGNDANIVGLWLRHRGRCSSVHALAVTPVYEELRNRKTVTLSIGNCMNVCVLVTTNGWYA